MPRSTPCSPKMASDTLIAADFVSKHESDRTSASPEHYVWVIHGTWNSPDGNEPKWFQPDWNNTDNFCTRLQAALAGGPLAHSVWRNTSADDVCSWSGANSYQERIKGAEKLAQQIYERQQRTPNTRLHLVAHSHGGNVVLDAIKIYRNRVEGEGRRLSDMIWEFAMKSAHSEHERKRFVFEAMKLVCGKDQASWPRAGLSTIRRALDVVMQNKRPNRRHDHGDRPNHTKAFVRSWFNSLGGDCIGNIVFMGTPFLTKKWLRPGNAFLRWCVNLYGVLPLTLGAVLITYLFGVGVNGVIGFASTSYDASWSPWHWPIVLCGLWLLFVVAIIVEFPFEHQPYDTALHGIKFPDEYNLFQKKSALVISASYLDEVILGLSAEPLVYATLIPRIRSVLYGNPRSFRQVFKFEFEGKVGESPDIGGFRPLINLPLRVLLTIGSAVTRPLTFPIRRYLLEPYLTRFLLTVISSAAFGVPSRELKGARIIVDCRLPSDQKLYFRENFWDVTHHVLSKASQGNGDKAVVDRRLRYGFLVDDSKLQKRCDSARAQINTGTGFLSGDMSNMFDVLYGQYERGYTIEKKKNADQFSKELARICFTTEERVRELAGGIELNHSMYYIDDTIIAGIASFLEKGKRDE